MYCQLSLNELFKTQFDELAFHGSSSGQYILLLLLFTKDPWSSVADEKECVISASVGHLADTVPIDTALFELFKNRLSPYLNSG